VVYGSGRTGDPRSVRAIDLKNVRFTFFIVYNLSPEDRLRATADSTSFLP